jgi:hypothetical protein
MFLQNVEKLFRFSFPVRTVGGERVHHAFVHKLSVDRLYYKLFIKSMQCFLQTFSGRERNIFVSTIATIPDGLSGKCRKFPVRRGWQARCRGPGAAGSSTLHILNNHVVIGEISSKFLCGTRCFLLAYWLNS